MDSLVTQREFNALVRRFDRLEAAVEAEKAKAESDRDKLVETIERIRLKLQILHAQ
jgi:hypothetical protein